MDSDGLSIHATIHCGSMRNKEINLGETYTDSFF